MKTEKEFYSDIDVLRKDIDDAGYSASEKQLKILDRISENLDIHGLDTYMSDFDFKIITKLKSEIDHGGWL
jgi:hypothetical protein